MDQSRHLPFALSQAVVPGAKLLRNTQRNLKYTWSVMQLSGKILRMFWEAGSTLEAPDWGWLAPAPWHCPLAPLASFCVLFCFLPFCSALSPALCPTLALSLGRLLFSLGLAGHCHLFLAACSRFTQTGFPLWCPPSDAS